MYKIKIWQSKADCAVLDQRMTKMFFKDIFGHEMSKLLQNSSSGTLTKATNLEIFL